MPPPQCRLKTKTSVGAGNSGDTMLHVGPRAFDDLVVMDLLAHFLGVASHDYIDAPPSCVTENTDPDYNRGAQKSRSTGRRSEAR